MAKKSECVKPLKKILFVALTVLLGCATATFTILYINTYTDGFLYRNSAILRAAGVSLILLVCMLTMLFYACRKEVLYKFAFLTLAFTAIALASLYFLTVSGFIDKVKTVEGFREYIASYGKNAVWLFIVLQFLQVVVLPIPGFIAVGAGVLLFGALRGAIFSFIGIVVGSLVAFFIGRVFGYKAAKWLVGEESLNKGLKAIKGKDKILLIFMFLFPFFPDDVLCFVAGITTVSPLFFLIMIFITRFISVFVSSYSMNNSIIPYDTWWGLLLWAGFFAFTITAAIIIMKKGDKIEKFFFRKKSK